LPKVQHLETQGRTQSQEVCDVCDAAWREYIQSMKAYLDAQLAAYMAADLNGFERHTDLNVLLIQAEIARDERWLALREHETEAHLPNPRPTQP
jgi:hypothetical protein